MLVGFVGAPFSGKTTTAAKVFAELKDSGQPAEYIAERARTFIAEKRYFLADGTLVTLTDDDQFLIAHSQWQAEEYMCKKETIVITDSCVLNSLLYMTPEGRLEQRVVDLVTKARPAYDLLFVCDPVQRPVSVDLNRVHDNETSLKIHQSIDEVLGKFLRQNPEQIHYISGPPHSRMNQVLSIVLQSFIQRL